MTKLLFVFGTRPEAIKFAPVIHMFRGHPGFETIVCVTGQHREMLVQALSLFEIKPDFDLGLMRDAQTLQSITTGVLTGVGEVIEAVSPDYVFVQGDTTTAMAASLAAFYARIPVCHVEAGLRTGEIYSPWPEELNRLICDSIARWYFAPTELARRNLLLENKNHEHIIVTGNTVIDALKHVVKVLDNNGALSSAIREKFPSLDDERRMVLVTGHRRENFGTNFRNFCFALRKLAAKYEDVQIIYPVHLNPNVQKPVFEILSGLPNIKLLSPQEYLPFVYLMRKAYFIITDSGGIQEEAPALSKPVLVTRDTTERPEAIIAGTAKLVGTGTESIFEEASRLLDDKNVYMNMAQAQNPYGDGTASEKIMSVLLEAKRNDLRDIQNETAPDIRRA